MRTTFLSIVMCAAAVSAVAQIPGKMTSYPPQSTPAEFQPLIGTTPPEIPNWSYSVTAGADLGGGVYNGTLLGRSPFLKGKTTTTIPLQIVPVKIIIDNTNVTPGDVHTYDPMVNDGCEASGHTALELVQNSPIFVNTNWTFPSATVTAALGLPAGTNMGSTQYHDAFTRASFWSLVGGTNYHLLENVTVLAEQTLTFGSVAGSKGPGTNYGPNSLGAGFPCGSMGVVDVNNLEPAVNSLLASLSPTVNVGTLPMILVNSVVSGDGTTNIFGNCCILGFHSGFTVGPNLQVTSIFDYDTSNLFGNNDVTVITHELGEALFDPNGINPTPVWGGTGQDTGLCPSGGGQNNLEVGDPLSPGFGHQPNQHTVNAGDSSNEFSTPGTGIEAGVITYHTQELAFFSWFYGGTNLGLPGYYSNNATFQGDTKLCSAGGGTN